jgi:hypothetical protein
MPFHNSPPKNLIILWKNEDKAFVVCPSGCGLQKNKCLSRHLSKAVTRMNSQKPRGPPTFRGRFFGVAALVAAQYGIGALHFAVGLALLVLGTPDVYSVYTLSFSVLTILFAYGLWKGKRLGWIGTVAVALFVIAADSLTLLDLPSIPGIPDFAGFGEITYSAIAVLYLCQAHVRAKYGLSKV